MPNDGILPYFFSFLWGQVPHQTPLLFSGQPLYIHQFSRQNQDSNFELTLGVALFRCVIIDIIHLLIFDTFIYESWSDAFVNRLWKFPGKVGGDPGQTYDNVDLCRKSFSDKARTSLDQFGQSFDLEISQNLKDQENSMKFMGKFCTM